MYYPKLQPFDDLVQSSSTSSCIIACIPHPDLPSLLSPILDPLLEQTEYATLRRRARRSSAFRKLTSQPHPVFALDLHAAQQHAMAPRVTRAAARAAVTVEICVDEVDVVHVIDVADEVGTGVNDEVVEGSRKVLEAVTGNLESIASEEAGGEEKTGITKKKKKNGTKRGKRKSRGVVVQEQEQQDEEEVGVAADVPGHVGVEESGNVDEEGQSCSVRLKEHQLIPHSNFGACEECRINNSTRILCNICG